MAYNLITGRTTKRDWSCGAGDLPTSSKGYVPDTYWDPDQMEAKLTSIMSKPKSFMGPKPTREEAVAMLTDYMKSRKIGPRDVTAGIGAEVGSIVFPIKEQAKLYDKIDDLRYDVRAMNTGISATGYALAGAISILAFG